MRLRQLRKERGWSLQELARRTGVSIGYLSQVERGLSAASLKLVFQAAEALGIGLASFFSADGAPPEAEPVAIRKVERGQLGLWQAGISKELLTPPRDASRLNLFLVHLDPGGTTGGEDYLHDGEEAGLVLSGRIELTVDGRSWSLSEGDSFRFRSNRPHRFRNDGDTPASVLWVNVTGTG
jgi:transcriptional regulator with XRE-family HTH domain